MTFGSHPSPFFAPSLYSHTPTTSATPAHAVLPKPLLPVFPYCLSAVFQSPINVRSCVLPYLYDRLEAHEVCQIEEECVPYHQFLHSKSHAWLTDSFSHSRDRVKASTPHPTQGSTVIRTGTTTHHSVENIILGYRVSLTGSDT